jgi:transcriptional regulator with XRE-family HTH domain
VSTVAGFATAFLSVRDEILAGMDERKLRLLRGALRGVTQAELAAVEGITQPAVSQLLTRSGAQAVRLAHEQLDRVLT